jgi:hypothetical protein
MPIERVVTQGLFSRLKSAIGGIAVGMVMVLVAAGLQFWNEGRTLRQQQLLEAGRAEVAGLPQGAAGSLDGRLVHRSGELRAEGLREDPEFGQVAEGLGLRRRVEMYQWKERKETREETSVGGSKTTRTIYHYDKVWDDELIDHSRFEQRSGHENPGQMPFEAARWMAEQVALDELALAPEVVAEIGGWKPMAVEESRLPANLAASFRVDGGRLTTEQGSPEIGDLRVSFERLPDGPLSVVARLEGGRLLPDQREQGELLLVERGQHSAEALFDGAERRNAGIGWALRLAGFVLMWIGFALVFAPLAVFSDIVPMFGRITRFVSGLVAGVLAAFISFVAIASGWLFNRPWLLGLFLIGIALAIVWMVRRGSARATPTAMPPPPPGA